MALHRDIHWLGRQWAVTGHGMQLIDQKLQGFFDIEADRLWDENLVASMRAKDWLNAADFDKGLAVARTRYPRPPDVATPPPSLPAPANESPEFLAQVENPEAPEHEQPAHVVEVQTVGASAPVEPPQQDTSNLKMCFLGRARFVRPWRAWIRH